MSVVDIRQYERPETPEDRADRVLAEARETIDQLSAALDEALADRASLLASFEREIAEHHKPWTSVTRDPHFEGELSDTGIDAVVERPSEAHHLAVVHIPTDDLRWLIARATCMDCDHFHGDEHYLFYAELDE